MGAESQADFLPLSPGALFFSASAETLGVHILRKEQDEFANQSAVRY
jgi:hypothetical protein